MAQRYPIAGEYNPIVPSRIIFGQGKADTLAAEVEALGGKRALVLSGRSVAERTSTVRRVNAALGGISAGVYSGLTQRAPLATAVEAANLAVAAGADTLVGVGGSTISDAARMIAVLMAEGVTTVEELRELGTPQRGLVFTGPDRKAAAAPSVHPHDPVGRGVQHGRRECARRPGWPQGSSEPSPALCRSDRA